MEPWLLTIFTPWLQIPRPGVCWPPPESSVCAFCQSHCQSNFVPGEQRLLWYNVISLGKQRLRTLQTGRNYMAPCIPDSLSLLAISLPWPLFLQEICGTKKKVTTQKVNSNSVAKSGDKEGNTVYLDSCKRLVHVDLEPNGNFCFCRWLQLNSLPLS